MQAKSFKELISPNKASAFSTHLQKRNPQETNYKSLSIIDRWANDKAPFKILKAADNTAKSFSDVVKFNPYHDRLGRFASASGYTSFTYAPGKSKAHDNAIAREKERMSGAAGSEPKAQQAERGHINPKSYEDSLNIVKKELGCDDKQAKKYVRGVLSYTSENYEAIRAYQNGVKNDYTKKFSRDSKTIEDYIDKAPHWNEGTLYRGIGIKAGEDVKSMFKPGTELDMQGTSSWTSDKATARSYARDTNRVVFQCESISKATSVTHLSSYGALEQEVLVSKNTKYVTKKVSKRGGIYYVYLDEVVTASKSYVAKFNPYHDRLGRFSSSGSAASFTYKPGASTAHSKAIEREKEKDSQEGKGFKGTLYHGSPNKDIKEFDMKRAGQNTSSGEKLLFFTDSKQMADDFSYERLDGSSKFFQERGKKGRVYEVDVEMKNPLDLRKLNDKDIDNILKLDEEGILTKDMVQRYANSNHQLLKAGLTLTSESLKNLGYDGLIANTGKAGHNSIEYAVVDSKQAKIKKSIASGGEDLNDEINKADKEKYALYIGLNVTGADHLAMDGGEDPKDFHVTLLYGYYHPVSDVEDTAMRIQSCREKAVKYLPDTLKLDAIGRFEASNSSDGKDVIYARVAPGQLEKAHDILLKALNERGLKVQPTFDEYNPHMTLAYIDPDKEVELKDIDETVTIKNLTEGFETDEASSKENENTFKIAKTDDDKRLVFGWALVAKDKDGNVIKDHQNDIVEENELEEGAYEYVLNFRDCGEEHIPGLRKKARMVESCVFTEEKQKALGIPKGTVPTGWWIGFYVDDDVAWEKIKDGTYKMFSIEGKAIRVPVSELETTIDLWNKQKNSKNDLTKSDNVAKTFAEILKFNPYHDRLGRFTSGGGFMASGYTGDKNRQAVTFSANPDTKAGAMAIERARGHHP